MQRKLFDLLVSFGGALYLLVLVVSGALLI